MVEAPPSVSTIVTTNAPSIVATTVVSKEASTTTTTSPSTETPLVTTTLIPAIPSSIATTSSQNVPKISVVIQKEATTPSTNTKLPPWMDIVAPKRKKRVILPDEFDFEQLTPPKSKSTKKPKTVSRVLVDPTTKMKYAEVMVPSSNKNKDNIQLGDYTMQTVELGVETHESVKLDSQTAVNSLMQRFDQERDEKNELKQKCEQLTSVLLKVIQSSQEFEPIVSSIDTEALEKVVQSQMQGVKTSLSQEVEDIGKSVTLWGKMEDFRIDILVENKVIPTREKYIQILSLLSHKKETIRSMIMELDREKKEGDDEIDLVSARVAEIPCYLYDDNQNLVTSDAFIQEFFF
ncbi:uncharacterized protein LOC131857677 [Cryptomeria japonica]|uniref:uncharacterized protein LOC131857677 n=1 Tax=Cryptomeria japonica TaxID=3369 RepID=UPI0027DA06B4|nr:uncharacterized protein LOC131857677 [Cryptomeria japonica]